MDLDFTHSSANIVISPADSGKRDFSSELIRSMDRTSFFHRDITFILPDETDFPCRIFAHAVTILRVAIHDFQFPALVRLLETCPLLQEIQLRLCEFISFFYFVALLMSFSVMPVYPITARRARLPLFTDLTLLAFDVCPSNINVVLDLLSLWPLPTTLDAVYMHVWPTPCADFHGYDSFVAYPTLLRVYQPSMSNLHSPLLVPIGINSPRPLSRCTDCTSVFPAIIARAHTLYPTYPDMYLAPHISDI